MKIEISSIDPTGLTIDKQNLLIQDGVYGTRHLLEVNESYY